MANEELPPNENLGPALLGTVWSLWAIATVIYIVRLCARPSSKFDITSAEYTITASLISKTVSVAFMTAAISKGFGRHNAYISTEDQGTIRRYLVGVYMSGVPASCLARVSIACLLLRLTTNRVWRGILKATIVLQVLVILVYEISQFTQCNSVITGISPTDHKCLPKSHVWGFTFMSFFSAMVSDFICATIPFFLLRHLSRSSVEKALIYILMASSVIATGMGIPKLYHVLTYEFGADDRLWNLLPEFFWCRMEEAVIIIAACAPLLKSPVERLLRRMGLPVFKIPTRALKSIRSQSQPGGLGDSLQSSGPDSSDSGCWGGAETLADIETGATTETKSTNQQGS
ncbi:hypothetical protein jhhlp_008812 [Lomentospora prolificans]|uniref:Rhodopsin domain-containing protein n=1 Tax=Lomentospora prolificans TaxID=41688 RepID=A0A2N3MZ26_9PEZI|nr:hypothetical protein jhhlp_008812 [Lomentospora prolificans]